MAYSAAGLVTRLRARIPEGTKIFSSPKQADLLWGPPAILFYGYQDSVRYVNWAGRNDHSPPSSAKVKNEWSCTSIPAMWGHAVALLVQAPHYKPEVSGFDSRWCYFIDVILRPHYGSGVDSASNRNEHQEYFLWGKGGRCVELTSLPIFLKPGSLKLLEPSGIFHVCTKIVLPVLVNSLMAWMGKT